MRADEAVSRARSAIGHQCRYALGKGGFNPAQTFPWNSRGECDCSGFVAWCLGVPRHVDHPWYTKDHNGEWLETSAIVRDAKKVGFGMFNEVPWAEARPGDLLVYGDSSRGQGHVGIVAEVLAGPTSVVHCSKGGWRVHGDAIAVAGSAAFLMRGAIVARYVEFSA